MTIQNQWKNNPWYNDTIASQIRERNNAWAKAKKSNDTKHWNEYRALRNKCTRYIKMPKVSII